MLNDADAAGRAEVIFGAGKDRSGVIIVLTLGTGIGSAVFLNGELVPNTELGHLFLENGQEAEDWVSDRVRKDQDLNWKKWGKRLDHYLEHLEFIFSPDLIILGGGVSKKNEKFMDYLKLNTHIIPATLRNEAGIVGAAIEAARIKTPLLA
jgi:polyphosphate glucokinase